MDLMDIFFTPAPSPMGCAKKKENEPVPENLIKYSSADMIAVLVKFSSSITICSLRDVTTNNVFGKTPEERIGNFAQSAAEFVVNVKYGKSHVTEPGDDPQVKEAIAGLKTNQKESLIGSLSALISDKMKKSVGAAGAGSDASQVNDPAERIINFTYATSGLREDYINWCPNAGAPYPRSISALNADGVPMPEPLTMYTKDELIGLIKKAQGVPVIECVLPDHDSMVKALQAMDSITRNAILADVGALPQPHYSLCSVSPAAVNSPAKAPAKAEEVLLTFNGEPLNLFDDEGKLLEAIKDKPLTVDLGKDLGVYPATLAEDKKSLTAQVKVPVGLVTGNKPVKQTITVKLGDNEIGKLEDGLVIKAKRTGGGGHKPAPTGFCATNPTDPKCNF